MNPPELHDLRNGDEDAWDKAFHWLWPTAFAVAQLKLQRFLPDQVEDVTIESLEQLVEEFKKGRKFKDFDEVKGLVACIAHHRAVSRLRRHFGDKRGGGRIESLDVHGDEAGDHAELEETQSPLDRLEEKELAKRLEETLAKLRPPLGEVLADFFLHGLKHEEIAKKRQIAVGSVGVHLKRGLEAIRRIWGRNQE